MPDPVVVAPKTVTPAAPQSAPVAAKPLTPVETPVVSYKDIMTRTAEPAPTPKPESPAPNAAPSDISIADELAKITDPTQRGIIEKKLKDLESGYNKKYQTLASQRAEVERLQKQMSTWTPERLRQELAKPEFVQSMQTLQQTAPPQDWAGSLDEWSALSPNEKSQFNSMRQETATLQSQMNKLLTEQEDTKVKELYPDYDPKLVDEAIEGLRTGNIVASRADIWKVVNHDQNVEKGYKFGYEDGYRKALEKLNGSSIGPGNLSVTSGDEPPDEVRKGGFASIANWRLSKARGPK